MRCAAHNLLAALVLASCLVLGTGIPVFADTATTVAQDMDIPFAATLEMRTAVAKAAERGQQKYEEEKSRIQRFLEHSPPTKKTVNTMAQDLARAKAQLRAQEIALALQPFFEASMRTQNHAEAQNVAQWQFALMRRAFSNYVSLPDNEYIFAPKELIPYYKNLGRLYTALQDWEKAVVNFGIEFRVKPEEGMAQALCTGATLAAEKGADHKEALANALLPFVKKAYSAKEWDRAEALGIWQVRLQEDADRRQRGLHDTSILLSDYYYNLGVIAKTRGSTYNAKEYFEKSLAPFHNSISRVNTANKVLPALELAQLEKAAQNPTMAHMRSSMAWEFMLTMPTIVISQGNDALQLQVWSLTAQGLYGSALQQATILVDFLQQSKMQNTPQMAQALYTLGNVHRLLGNGPAAQQNYMAALDIYKQDATLHPAEQADLLTELAHYCRTQGQLAQAVALLKDAIALYTHGPSLPLAEGLTYALLAEIYEEMGEKDKALSTYRQLLAVCEAAQGDPASDHTAANLLRGECYLRLGQYEKAIDALQLAYMEHVFRLKKPPAVRCSSLLMQVYAGQGQPHAAIFWGKHAVNALQQIRADVQRASLDTQRTFIHSQSAVYHTLIDILHNQGRTFEAEHVYSLLKTAELRQFAPGELFGRASGQTVPFVGIEQNLDTLLFDCAATLNGFSYGVNTAKHWGDRVEYPIFSYEKKPIILKHMGVVSLDTNNAPIYLKSENKEIMREMLRSQSSSLVYERNYPEDIVISPETLPALQRRFETEKGILRTFLQALPQTLATKSQPFGQEHLQKAIRNLDEDTVLLHAVSTADTLWLWVSDSGGKILNVHNIAVPRQVLAQHVRELRTIVTERKLDPRPAAKRLYDILFAPVEKEVQKIGPKTILFSLDGVLRYIPPAILHDGTQWLVERYALGLFLEASKDCLTQRPNDWSVGGLGITEPRGEFAPLPGVERELASIVRSASNAQGIIPGKLYLNKDFTEQSLLSVLDEKMSILHVATHFKLDPDSASSSFLLLGDGTKLSLTHLASEKFSFKALQQITLSACETGIKLGSSGSEIESLGALVQQKGAQSVIATLWSISDASASLVMPAFYKNIVKNGLPRAEALRQAQLAMLRGTLDSESDHTLRGSEDTPLRRRDMPGYRHPYYWGAFILMGNWQ